MSESITGNVQGFTALTQQQAVAIQASVAATNPRKVLQFSKGSVLLALTQAVSGVALWLQAMALNLLLYARATTAVGADLDSWMADFQFARIAGQASTCETAILTRYSASQPVIILPGGSVQTSDGSQQFTVVADTTQAAWSVAAGGYSMAAGVTSVQVTVVNAVPGVAGNVAAGTITAFASGIIGADLVNNTGAAVGGADPEKDPAFRVRFWNYLQYLFRATAPAIIYAAQSVQSGLTATIVASQDEQGNLKPGYFYVTVDDGTGAPPASLIAAVSAAVDAARGVGMTYAVHGPARIVVNLTANIYVASGYISSSVIAAAQAAATAYVNSAILGQNLSYWKAGSAIEAVAGVSELVSLSINGAASDVTTTPQQKIVAGIVTISPLTPAP